MVDSFNALQIAIIEDVLEEDINFNVIFSIAQHLMEPVNIAPYEREVPIRNENYYEEVIPRYTPDDFWAHFRMSRSTFEILLYQLQYMRPDVQDYIPFDKKVLFSIWVLSNPESFKAAGHRFNLAPSTSHTTFFEIIKLIANLHYDVIVWPNQIECERIARSLATRSNIPGIIGIIDSCHIAIKAPPHNPIDYYNRNNFHSVILQAVCNDKKEFIDVFAGTPGRVHDAHVLQISPLYNSLIGNNVPISQTQHLLGDSAYPLLPFLLTPYRDNGHLGDTQTTFNTTMSSVRSLLEQAFDVLIGKFRRLKYLDMSRTDMIPTVILAACVLHNIILRNDGFINEQIEDQEVDEQVQHLELDLDMQKDTLGERKRDLVAALLK